MSDSKVINIFGSGEKKNYENLYPVTEIYQVFLACPDCGTDMKPDNPPVRVENGICIFHYTCPDCGKKVETQRQYPHQRVTYDTVNVIKQEVEL